jgi:hypothetical protein
MKKVLLVLSVFALTFSMNAQSNCPDLVTESYDEFDNEYTYRSSPLGWDYSMSRVGEYYYLRVTTPAYTTGAIGESGLTLILKDGTRLFWDEKLDTDVASSGAHYVVSAFVSLSESQLIKLSESNPDKARLYIFDKKFEDKEYTTAFKCIMSK